MKKNILLVAKSVKAQILLIYISGSYILLKIKSKLISVWKTFKAKNKWCPLTFQDSTQIRHACK